MVGLYGGSYGNQSRQQSGVCGAGRSVSLGLKFKSSTVQKGITKVVPFLVRSRRDSRRGKAPVTPAHSQMLPRSICALKGRSRLNPSMQKRNHKSGSFLARSRRDSNPRAGINRQTHFECASLRPLRYDSTDSYFNKEKIDLQDQINGLSVPTQIW